MTKKRKKHVEGEIPTLWDAQKAQEEGMAAAAKKAGREWREYALDFVEDYCRHNETVFCDDVWNAGLRRPESPRAFGQVMKEAKKRGWVTATDRARPSTQSNNSVRTVYQSNLHQVAATG